MARSATYVTLLAAGRAREPLTRDSDLVVARAMDRLACEDADWLFIWRSMTKAERRDILRAAKAAMGASVEARVMGRVR